MLDNDAVTCCPLPDSKNNFTEVSPLSADMRWLAGVSEAIV